MQNHLTQNVGLFIFLQFFVHKLNTKAFMPDNIYFNNTINKSSLIPSVKLNQFQQHSSLISLLLFVIVCYVTKRMFRENRSSMTVIKVYGKDNS